MISIDFSRAYRQADSMAQCAEEMLQQHKKMAGVIEEIRGAWQGETASSYIKKIEGFSSQLKANSEKCRKDAAAFRARIDAIKEAEEEAAAAIAASAAASGE